jgi:hypothetical protein
VVIINTEMPKLIDIMIQINVHKAKMGQYYKAVFLSNDRKIIGWSENQGGSKMMEQAYQTEPYILFIQQKLYKTPMRIVWAGDYAPAEDVYSLEEAINALKYIIKIKDIIYESDRHYVEKAQRILSRRYTEGFDTSDCECMTFAINNSRRNLFNICDAKHDLFISYDPNVYKYAHLHRYLINHTKNEYIDIDTSYNYDSDSDSDSEAYYHTEHKIHPLPLLTAEVGTGGGGDYRGKANEYVGYWARDVISSSDEVPEGFTKLVVEF